MHKSNYNNIKVDPMKTHLLGSIAVMKGREFLHFGAQHDKAINDLREKISHYIYTVALDQGLGSLLTSYASSKVCFEFSSSRKVQVVIPNNYSCEIALKSESAIASCAAMMKEVENWVLSRYSSSSEQSLETQDDLRCSSQTHYLHAKGSGNQDPSCVVTQEELEDGRKQLMELKERRVELEAQLGEKVSELEHVNEKYASESACLQQQLEEKCAALKSAQDALLDSNTQLQQLQQLQKKHSGEELSQLDRQKFMATLNALQRKLCLVTNGYKMACETNKGLNNLLIRKEQLIKSSKELCEQKVDELANLQKKCSIHERESKDLSVELARVNGQLVAQQLEQQQSKAQMEISSTCLRQELEKEKNLLNRLNLDLKKSNDELVQLKKTNDELVQLKKTNDELVVQLQKTNDELVVQLQKACDALKQQQKKETDGFEELKKQSQEKGEQCTKLKKQLQEEKKAKDRLEKESNFMKTEFMKMKLKLNKLQMRCVGKPVALSKEISDKLAELEQTNGQLVAQQKELREQLGNKNAELKQTKKWLEEEEKRLQDHLKEQHVVMQQEKFNEQCIEHNKNPGEPVLTEKGFKEHLQRIQQMLGPAEGEPELFGSLLEQIGKIEHKVKLLKEEKERLTKRLEEYTMESGVMDSLVKRNAELVEEREKFKEQIQPLLKTVEDLEAKSFDGALAEHTLRTEYDKLAEKHNCLLKDLENNADLLTGALEKVVDNIVEIFKAVLVIIASNEKSRELIGGNLNEIDLLISSNIKRAVEFSSSVEDRILAISTWCSNINELLSKLRDLIEVVDCVGATG